MEKRKARGRGRPRAKIETTPLGGKWDGAEFYSFSTPHEILLCKACGVPNDILIRTVPLETWSRAEVRAARASFHAEPDIFSMLNLLPLNDKRRDLDDGYVAQCARVSDV